MAQFILAIPLAVIWVALSNRFTWSSLVIGLIIGFIIVTLLRVRGVEVNIYLRKLPSQAIWVTYYIIRLTVDIFISSIQVATLLLTRRELPEAGFETIWTQDETGDLAISALSGHAITITPGQLVVDYETEDDAPVMMEIHCLDIKQAAGTLEGEQARRLQLIRRVLGYD